MTITINGTTGVAGVDGSASTPAYQGNDTNTGIAFPAADTVAVSTGGSERMRVTAAGDVGIGTSSPSGRLHVESAGTNYIYTRNSASAGIAGLICQNTGDTRGWRIDGTNFDAYDFSSAATRLRITSGGEVYIAGTTDQGAYNLQCNGTGVWGAGAYVNGSDARIKEDVTPISSSLEVVEKLNPVTYRYKEDWSKDQSTQTGFIAQELLVALEGQNYVDGIVQQGGSEGYYSVAYQNIIPILTKAIQELNSKVEAQAAEIAALKGQA